MIVKLTDSKGQTYNNTQWGPGVRNTAIGEGTELCSSDLIHYYDDEYLSVFANPSHCDFKDGDIQMWEFQPDAKVAGDALKSGCKSGVTIRQVTIPAMTTEQRIEIAVRCALAVYHDDNWIKWANAWLDGTDRSIAAASAAAYAASAAAYAASAAANAAYCAANAASDAYKAANAAFYAANAANAAKAAYKTADCAADAINVYAKIDVIKIIKQVMGVKDVRFDY